MERLTIDQIIEHCDETVKKIETFARRTGSEIDSKHYQEHKQVGEYLRELKQYRSLREKELDEKHLVLARYIIQNVHSCPIPVELVCECGFQREGCAECLLKHLDVLLLPKED